jgi:hypothetical protein
VQDQKALVAGDNDFHSGGDHQLRIPWRLAVVDTNVRVCSDGSGGERPENLRTAALGDHTSKLGPTKNLVDLVEGATGDYEGVALSSGQERTARQTAEPTTEDASQMMLNQPGGVRRYKPPAGRRCRRRSDLGLVRRQPWPPTQPREDCPWLTVGPFCRPGARQPQANAGLRAPAPSLSRH